MIKDEKAGDVNEVTIEDDITPTAVVDEPAATVYNEQMR